MIEIGKTRLVIRRTRDKSTGKIKARLDAGGSPVREVVETCVWRITRKTLGGNFGVDRNRRLVVGLVSPDQIAFRPQGTRQIVRINIVDAYRDALRNKANLANLERARKRKAAKAEQRQRQAIARADRRIRLQAKAARE